MPALIAPAVVRTDLTLARPLRRGDKSRQVRTLQEWLNLHDQRTSVDGAFGPATERALSSFQERAGLQVSGQSDGPTFDALVAPVRRASAIIGNPTLSVSELVIEYAHRHLAEHPREVGGQNLGPWVRLYMDGNEGTQWPWCAGFVTFIMRQVALTLASTSPVVRTFSCDVLAEKARQSGRLVTDRTIVSAPDPATVLDPGSVFLVRRVANDWNHTGIAISFQRDTFETIEGNTNDSGSREGFEVCRRFRSYDKKDFIRIT